MTPKQFHSLIEGQLIVIKDGNERYIVAFNKTRILKSLNAYMYCGCVYHYEDISIATEKDYKFLLERENERHKKTIESIEGSWQLTKGVKQ